MKLIRFQQNTGSHEAEIGMLSEDEASIHPLSPLLGRQLITMQQLIVSLTPQELSLLAAQRKQPGIPRASCRLLAPIQRPLHDILCVGVNYKAHREELRDRLPLGEETRRTVYFAKRALSILGDGEPIPARFDLDEQLDYEAELAVIIGKKGRDIPKEQAEDYIFGYSIFNDLSSRQLQKQHSQWFRGKSLDGYAAMGPCILHKSALPFPIETDVLSLVNGEVRQHSNTSLLLTDLPTIISELSSGMTLEPGDIISTGTPSGIGMSFTPSRFLQNGDRVECRIPPIGSLTNQVAAPQEQENH